nr:unnamed protein product [Digitaria exilis]
MIRAPAEKGPAAKPKLPSSALLFSLNFTPPEQSKNRRILTGAAHLQRCRIRLLGFVAGAGLIPELRPSPRARRLLRRLAGIGIGGRE